MWAESPPPHYHKQTNKSVKERKKKKIGSFCKFFSKSSYLNIVLSKTMFIDENNPQIRSSVTIQKSEISFMTIKTILKNLI